MARPCAYCDLPILDPKPNGRRMGRPMVYHIECKAKAQTVVKWLRFSKPLWDRVREVARLLGVSNAEAARLAIGRGLSAVRSRAKKRGKHES